MHRGVGRHSNRFCLVLTGGGERRSSGLQIGGGQGKSCGKSSSLYASVSWLNLMVLVHSG
jgi:hypothetical protein